MMAPQQDRTPNRQFSNGIDAKQAMGFFGIKLPTEFAR
jgi:hypothetical protein